MNEYYFEKLEVWKNSKTFIIEIYKITIDFSNDEKFGIISQIRRASLSIASNIAEGMSRMTNKDKARFINQAYSSAIEVLNFLIISFELNFLSEANYLKLRKDIEFITNQLNALYKKLLTS